MNVALYVRVSTQDQDCSLQLAELRAWSFRHEWTIVQEYADKGVSGGRADRPQLMKLMKDAEAKMFACVLVYKLDRFGRSMLHLTQALQDLERWGIRFVATSQGIDTDRANPTSRLLVHILSAVAEFEKSLIQERTRLGVRNAIAKGKRIGKPPAFFDRTKALRLRDTGKSWRAIADEMNVPYSTLRQNIRAEEAAAKEGLSA